MPEGWWNWGGIVRPVHLEAVGPAHLQDLGTMSQVHCRGQARRCRADLLLDGTLERRSSACAQAHPRRATALTARPHDLPVLPAGHARLRQPARAPLHARAAARAVVPRAAAALLRAHHAAPARRGAAGDQPANRDALRDVKRGHLYLNNRRVQLRGASIHEDMPGHGAALTELGHGHDRERAEGPGRERDARPLPDERPPALALRPGRDHGVERGADLAARPAGPTSSGARRSATGRWSRWRAR